MRRFLFSAFLTTIFAVGCGGDESRPPGGASAEPLFGDRKPDESVKAPGLSARAEIARDEFGVPHIYAASTKDAAFAQGYMHAHDRLFQIDLYRHLIEGRLCEYFGEITFNTDVGNRTNMMTTEGRLVFDVMVEKV